jgi:hypothetical protein|nr:MAG TPA: hypothetical protein [Caudoviricetes sp.]
MSDTKKDFELKSRLRQFQEAQLPKLGTGQARKAGEELYRRSDRVDAAVEQASQPAPAEREEREEDQRKVPADFRFADGGTVGSPLREEKPWWMPSLSWLGTGAARNAGEAMAGRPRQIDNAVDAMSNGQAPQQPQYPQPQQPQEEEEQPSRPAPAGFRFADGGRVNGKGGRTDDKVGPVMLSDEEYVLPADTADAIGRDVLDQLRLHTHDFVSDKKESALRKQQGAADHLADGGSPDWLEKGKALGQRALAGAQQYGNQAIDYAKSKLPGLQQQAADYGRQGLAYGKQVGAQAADFARTNLNPDALRAHAATVQKTATETGAQLKDQFERAAYNPAERRQLAMDRVRAELGDKPVGSGQANPQYRTPQAAAPATPATPQPKAPGLLQKTGSALRDAGGAVRSAVNSPLNKVATGLGVASAAAQAGGQELKDQESGYAQAFNESMGDMNSIGGSALRVLSGIGDNLTGGYATRVGQGISSMLSGEGFSDGFNRATHREQFEAAHQPAPVTPAAPANAPASPAPVPAANPVPTAPAAAPVETSPGYTNLGNYGYGGPDILGTSTRADGKLNSFTNVAPTRLRAPKDQAENINAIFDRMRHERGSDWWARHGAGLDAQRAGLLLENQRNMTANRGQDQLAQAADASAQLRAAEQNENAIQSRLRQAANAGQLGSSMMKALMDNDLKREELSLKRSSMAQERADKQAGQFDKAVDGMFIGADGKADAKQAQAFRQFLGQSNLKVDGKSFTNMTPQERLQNLAQARNMFDLMQRQNAGARTQSSTYSPIVGSKNGYSLGDVVHGDASIADYMLSNVSPLRQHQVVVDSMGRPHMTGNLLFDGDKINGDLAALVAQTRR